jgi:hypothetical protein
MTTTYDRDNLPADGWEGFVALDSVETHAETYEHAGADPA